MGGKLLNIADAVNCAIEDYSNPIIIAGGGPPSATGEGILATQANINNPFGIEHGPDGSIYFVENRIQHNPYHAADRVRKIDRDGYITTIANLNYLEGYSGDSGLAINAGFSGLMDIAVADDGTIYLAETWGPSRVRVIDPQGYIDTLVLGQDIPGYVGYGNKDILAVAVSPDGDVYFSQQDPWAIFKVDSMGTVTRVVGTGEWGETSSGLAINAEIPGVYGMTY